MTRGVNWAGRPGHGQQHGTALPVKLKGCVGPGTEARGKGTAWAQPTTTIIKIKKKLV